MLDRGKLNPTPFTLKMIRHSVKSLSPKLLAGKRDAFSLFPCFYPTTENSCLHFRAHYGSGLRVKGCNRFRVCWGYRFIAFIEFLGFITFIGLQGLYCLRGS